MPDNPDEGYLIEFHRIGNSIKVSAVDPQTGAEVSIVGSPRAPRSQLVKVAVNKLQYVLAKKA